MITYRVTILNSTTNSPIFGVAVDLVASWGATWAWQSPGSKTFSGTTDGNGQYQIALSDIGFTDSPYSINGRAAANGYYGTQWVSRTINGNYNNKVIDTVKYMTPNYSIGGSGGSGTTNNLLQNVYGGTTNPLTTLNKNEPVLIWIIALIIIIAVVALFFVMRGKGGGAAKPRAVIY